MFEVLLLMGVAAGSELVHHRAVADRPFGPVSCRGEVERRQVATAQVVAEVGGGEADFSGT